MQPIAATDMLSPWNPGVFSLVVYTAVVLVLVGLLLLICARIGKINRTPEKSRPYESGIIPTGDARLRYPAPFFLVAIFFLIFDVESAYIFAWAVACIDLGWRGYLQISFFIIVLLLGLVYVWAKGGLEWGPSLKKKIKN